MKTIFNISDAQTSGNEELIISMGTDHVLYALLNREQSRLSKVVYTEVDLGEIENVLPGIINDAGPHGSKVYVSSSFPQSLLLPQSGKDPAPLLQSIYELPEAQVLRDEINEWRITNVYAIPAPVYKIIQHRFPSALYTHLFSCSLRVYNGVSAENQMALHFTTRSFSVIVKKNGALQLAQIYSYTTPLDVIYYLLKITSELELDQANVYLVVSGLIDEESALYRQLKDYFLHHSFANASKLLLPSTELPDHFFHSILNLASCAS